MEWIAFGTVVALAWWWWRRKRASERRAAREHQVLERKFRLTTCFLHEAKAEIRTLKDRICSTRQRIESLRSSTGRCTPTRGRRASCTRELIARRKDRRSLRLRRSVPSATCSWKSRKLRKGMPSSRATDAVVDSDTEMFSQARLPPRNSVCALCICVAIAAFAPIHQRAWAGDGTWADITDVTQYVPLAWAAVHTFHARDVDGAFQMAIAGIGTVGTSEVLKRAVNERRPNYRPGDRKRSFPSGHVAKAWFAAAHLQRRYGCYELEAGCWRESAAPYLAAVVTAIGRVRADRHHVVDVIASAVIAETWVRFTTDRLNGDVHIAPSFDHGFGVAIFKEF